jgi:alpha-1,3-rhamnosyl/mannosyltransferase
MPPVYAIHIEFSGSSTPVNANNTPGRSEVIGDAGLMADPNDVNGIMAGMRRVLADDDLREDQGQCGLARPVAFSWEGTARENLAVCERVVRWQRKLSIGVVS